MKRSIFTVFAVLTLLVAAPLMAQQNDDPQQNELQPYETRTNPDAASISGQSGLTITGTVVESNDEQLTLRTTTGIEHIQIVPRTQSPVDLTAGQTVSVDYTRTSQGVMIAQKIRTSGATEESATTTTTTAQTDTESMNEGSMDESMGTDTDSGLQAQADVDTTADTTMDDDFDTDASLDTQADYGSDVDASADFDASSDLDTSADLDTTMNDQESLPATGSELPLLALLGLLSVAAAVGVRTVLR